MKSKWIEKKLNYDGSQLRSLFAYLDHGVLGDSIVSWAGPCDVDLDHMVDGEDVLAGSSIKAKLMLHFVIEKFETKLFSAVALQRLFAEIIIAHIKQTTQKSEIALALVRCGDDIYYKNKKFNISIATVSPSSALIHFAVNIDGTGAPVETLSLAELGTKNTEAFSKAVMDQFCAEVQSMERACQKVK